jgi:hypothetical protein
VALLMRREHQLRLLDDQQLTFGPGQSAFRDVLQQLLGLGGVTPADRGVLRQVWEAMARR